jgi:hypothetical protein
MSVNNTPPSFSNHPRYGHHSRSSGHSSMRHKSDVFGMRHNFAYAENQHVICHTLTSRRRTSQSPDLDPKFCFLSEREIMFTPQQILQFLHEVQA